MTFFANKYLISTHKTLESKHTSHMNHFPSDSPCSKATLQKENHTDLKSAWVNDDKTFVFSKPTPVIIASRNFCFVLGLFSILGITLQTLVLLQWSGDLWSDPPCQDPEKNTCWFSWCQTHSGYSGYQHTGPQVLGSHIRRPPGLVRIRTYNCARCPGKAPPTPDSSSGRDEHHPVIGCVDLWSSAPFCPSPSNETQWQRKIIIQ